MVASLRRHVSPVFLNFTTNLKILFEVIIYFKKVDVKEI
jgi:hypothetical protein